MVSSVGTTLRRVTIHTAIGARTADKIADTCQDDEETATIATLIIIITTAAALAGGGITRCICQARSVAPNLGWVQSHHRKRSELLEKAHKAMMRKTVVGNPGRKAPTKPRPTQTQPNARKTGHRLECVSGGGGTSSQSFGRLSVSGAVMFHPMRTNLGCRPSMRGGARFGRYSGPEGVTEKRQSRSPPQVIVVGHGA